MNKTSLEPQSKRIHSLDVLRGIALLGILIMNIQSFAMPSAAYMNPAAFGDLNGINKTVWMVSHILADQKFLSLFSLLFGAGIILFSENVECKGYLPARFYYKRLFWLFTFGLIHGYLFWQGDILVAYAVCGALAFVFRKINPIALISIGLVTFMVPSFNYWLFGRSMEMWPPEALSSMHEMWTPGQETIDKELEALTGSFSEQLIWRIPETFRMETFIFLILIGWRALAFMMIGMGLYKLNFFNKGFSNKILMIMAAVGSLIGVTLIFTGINKNFSEGWALEYSMFFGFQWNYFGSLFVALAYAALVMLLVQSFRLSLLANVGRMAFSNYILTTLICSFLFYGTGLGLIGQLERWEQGLIVFGIWAFLIAFSWLWLKRFYYGPLEWVWRYLTYGNKPVLKRN